MFFFQSPSEPPCGVCTWVYSLVLAARAWQLFKEGVMYTQWAIFNWIDLAWLQTDILEAQTQISCQSETVIEQPGSLSQPCLKARKWGALGVKDLTKGANGLPRLQGEQTKCLSCRYLKKFHILEAETLLKLLKEEQSLASKQITQVNQP